MIASSFVFDAVRFVITKFDLNFYLTALVVDPVLEVLGVVVADASTELSGLLVFELEVEFPAEPSNRVMGRVPAT